MAEETSPSQGALSIELLPRYRINFLNPNGTIFRTKVLEALNDDDATQAARRLMDGRALDLWEGVRFIEFFPRIDPPA